MWFLIFSFMGNTFTDFPKMSVANAAARKTKKEREDNKRKRYEERIKGKEKTTEKEERRIDEENEKRFQELMREKAEKNKKRRRTDGETEMQETIIQPVTRPIRSTNNLNNPRYPLGGIGGSK